MYIHLLADDDLRKRLSAARLVERCMKQLRTNGPLLRCSSMHSTRNLRKKKIELNKPPQEVDEYIKKIRYVAKEFSDSSEKMFNAIFDLMVQYLIVQVFLVERNQGNLSRKTSFFFISEIYIGVTQLAEIS